MKVLKFPSKAVLQAVRALEQSAGPEVDELAASILVLALKKREPIPRRTETLLIAVILRNLGSPLATKLGAALSGFIEDFEVLHGDLAKTRPVGER